MSDHLAAELARLSGRLRSMVAPAKVQMVDDSTGAQRMQLAIGAYEQPRNIPRLAEFGFFSSPPAGSDAIALFLGGDRSNAYVISTNHQTLRPANQPGGSSGLYDAAGSTFTLPADGTMVAKPANGTFIVEGNLIIRGKVLAQNADGSVSALVIDAVVQAMGDVVAGTAATGGGVSALSHTHMNAGGTGNSGTPNAGT